MLQHLPKSLLLLLGLTKYWEYRNSEYPASVRLKDGDRFDYIVVGAGAAGVPAAARLALAGANVLLVEAGGNPNQNTKVPALFQSLLGSDIDWQYPTISNNKSCLSYKGKQCRFGRGKCLGGSTSINYMIYVRGNPHDYDELGIKGWAWKDINPYFLKYEGLQDLHKLPDSSIPYHNTKGTMKIEFFADSENRWHSRTIKGYQYLNFPFNYDVNAKSQIGITQVIGYVYKGERMSTARGYLQRDDVKAALKISKNTYCTGVILDEDNNAIGIKVFVKNGNQQLRLYVNKEVVLSAGTIGTPQILMLSGIGPASHLKDLDITVRADLPVGNHMVDHVFPEVFLSVYPGDAMPTGFSQGKIITTYSNNRNGPLASIGITDLMLFVNTHCYDFHRRKLVHNRSDCELPTLQLTNGFINTGMYQNRLGINKDITQQLMAENKNKALILSGPLVLRPFSRGLIRLASRDPLKYPAIYPNYLADDRDVEEMLRGIMIVERLAETPEYKARNATLVYLKFPDCPNHEVDLKGYWRCYCRHMTVSLLHAVGTAQMGAVLDSRLRVLGVKRLRVADLSVLPKAPRGNTAAVAIAIGERVADLILEDAKKFKLFNVNNKKRRKLRSRVVKRESELNHR